VQLKRAQIPEVQKDSQVISVFFALFGSEFVKAEHKTLSKLTPGVIFHQHLSAHLLYESKLSSFSLITFGYLNFWHQNIGKKALVKC